MSERPQFAAVDLGSNSFHMVVARMEDGRLEVIDRIKECVGLAAGLGPGHVLDDDTRQSALQCLSRFGERLSGIGPRSVRAVGTSTLRRASNTSDFLHEAQAALGHRIEVISGQEEARLVYLGVSRSVPDLPRRRLVVDIGGGSTELILGQGARPLERDSLQVGHLRWTLKFFKDTPWTEEAWDAARTRARLELGGLKRRYRSLGWEAAYGSSGTARSIEAILLGNGWTDQGITAGGLRRLRDVILKHGTPEKLLAAGLAGLTPDRAPVIAGGAAILTAVFETLDIEMMTASTGALREGVLHDLIGRAHDDDSRDETIAALQARYAVDRAHAARLFRTARGLLDQVAEAWSIDPAEGTRLLHWAASVLEVGLSVNHSGYHKHGAYLVSNADLPGFSKDDQRLLAALVLGHRRKLLRERIAEFVGPARLGMVMRLIVLLRIAVRLHRTRSSRALPHIEATTDGDRLTLRFPPGWLDEHPLKRADLLDEASLLPGSGFELGLE